MCADSLYSANPLFPQSIPLKAGHMLLYPPTLCLLLFQAQKKPRKQQHTGARLGCKESQREGRRDWIGKQEIEGRGEILWEECQSNYRQRCRPGFFGGAKITFQLALLSAPFCCSFLLFSSISTHHGPHSACFLFPFVCFTRLHKRARAIYVYHQQNTLSPFSCVMSKCVRSLQHHSPWASQNRAGAYQASAERQQPTLVRSAHPSVLPETPAGMNGWYSSWTLERQPDAFTTRLLPP